MAIGSVVDWNNLGRTLAGANVSNRRDDWTRNYRIPVVSHSEQDRTIREIPIRLGS